MSVRGITGPEIVPIRAKGQRHVDRGGDPPRSAAEDEHAVSEIDGLVDVVRDVDDRDALLLVTVKTKHEVL